MYLPKIGMITFSDPREHEFHVLYEKKTESRMKTAKRIPGEASGRNICF